MINIVLVEDNLFQALLVRTCLERESDFSVVGYAIDRPTAESETDRFKPDVLILDLGLPDILALDIIPRLKVLSPKTHIVVYTAKDQAAYQEIALSKGASYFVSKSEPIRALINTVRLSVGRELSLRQSW